MSQSDVKADENTYISCISILFGRFSEECEHLTPIISSGGTPSRQCGSWSRIFHWHVV